MAYSHPRAQACLLGCVLFLTVGTYNVITFLGGAGQQTAYLSDVANITLYTVFAAFCIVAPAALNYFGLRLTLCFGGFGYAAYAASLWCFNHTGNTGFVIFGGAWCGLSAAMLWCAEGTAITAFASENKKGLYVSIMWSIFQSGVVIGAAIPVGQNWNAGSNNQSRVDDGTYIGLLILILFGAFLSLVLYPWQKMVREDGSKVLVERHQSFFQELQSSWQVFKTHTWIILFWPWCWAINYYNVYQSNNFNGVVFTVRARALNVLCSGIVQIFAAWVLQLITDGLPAPRRTRAFAGAAYNFVVFNAVWIGGYYAMVRTRENLPESERLDVYDSGYGAWAFLYVMYGFMDATYNCYAYWFMGALSNDPVEVSIAISVESLTSLTGFSCLFIRQCSVF
jgi:MFS family permease